MKKAITILAAVVTAIFILWISGIGRESEPREARAESPKSASAIAPAAAAANAHDSPASPASRAALDAPASRASAEVSGRFVDVQHQPIAGVDIYPAMVALGSVMKDADVLPNLANKMATSDDRGEFKVLASAAVAETARLGGRIWCRWIAQKKGFRRHVFEFESIAQQAKALGDVQLDPGGDLRGIVVDDKHRPAAGAEVELRDAGDFAPPRFTEGARHAPRTRALRSVRTEADGRFVIEGIPVGKLRCTAQAEDVGFAVGEIINMQAGDDVELPEMILIAPDPAMLIQGRVVDPAGAGVKSLVRIAYKRGSSSVTARDDGTFKWPVEGDGPYKLSAIGNTEKDLSGSTEVVADAGARDVVLTLTRPRELDLKITGESGELIRNATISINAEGQANMQGYAIEPPETSLHARVRLPGVRFKIGVQSAGYEGMTSELLDPAQVPASMHMMLRKLPAIQGRVVHQGRPVAGAWVSLHRGVDGRRGGFSVRYVRDLKIAAAEAQSDPDGSFTLAPSDFVDHAFLRASPVRFASNANRENAIGLAAGETGPFNYDVRTGMRDVVIEMTSGGGISGRLIRPIGRSAAGLTIGASNGGGEPEYTQTDADGSYAFKRLQPGKYQVKWVENTAQEITADPGASEPKWNCSVEEGVVTPYDLDYSQSEAAILCLELKLGSVPAAGASVRISGLNSERSSTDCVLDAGGRARIEMKQFGTINVMAVFDAPNHLKYRVDLAGYADAHGETRMVCRVPCGSLRVSGAAAESPLQIISTGPPVRVVVDATAVVGSPCVVDPVPIGSLLIRVGTSDPRRAQVTEGAVTELKLN